MDSHTEAHLGKLQREKTLAMRTVSQVSLLKKKKSFKKFKRDRAQVMIQGKDIDDLQYVMETDCNSHLFACYLLSVFGGFAEGHKSEAHHMSGNSEVMDLWVRFSSELMSKMAAENI